MGIVPNQTMQTRSIHAIFSLFYLMNCILLSIFLVHEANSTEEYMGGGFLTAVSILTLICYIILTFEMKKLFEYIDSAEKIVEQSEYKLKVLKLKSNSFKLITK